ncbi:MAG: aminotransferase class I/II-fold pyridoxal phosphate-dependent enzyme [Nitrosopumilaceae archaeon]|jgi:aspartate aminotransferase|uniref:Aminotransferase class I/II-fold pyridoxal phosphate-dependent enzyme n=3 Tax=Candidatus Nitrosomaritimum aestuariumsis TaxID=3342354 RepID=A0AC60W1E0_9ARCH|nr:aminotransferase class I/II-fold pyridoxal phosphate-dependent enzyme [Nitrosopumilaceae archaeon]MBA4453410.1 aminotransferase class I/II-fold pyridoxal phosphate-dependent enzyme [Nitrosopumilaceae archaeon]MBA4461680.1 aminotransferase class I/II-fold pyridoxal phosphate-dependent enzyme [Nitrosopumilaceae archaeon]MBA4462630.1 aminotransferase class I/II-fold pyridoxal phosphate-dependent enzyme [Nitrosopumilaceae archaeon]
MAEINELRSKMDEITIDMIKMLKARTDIAKEIGEIKKNIGKGITDESREDNLRTKIISLCNELDFDETIATKFLNFLLNESIKVQSNNKQTHLSIFLKAKSMEQEGKKIIHMEVGEPDFLPPTITKQALGEAYDKGFLKYGQAKGIPQFREALSQHVSKIFKAKVTQDNIMVTPGARFGIFTAINTLLNPGDELIVIEPAWPAYKDCALHAGVKVRTINTTFEDKWEPSIQQIEQTINPNTKMIALNYPNNPTGKILPEKLQDEIVNLAIKNNLFILSDEIYSQYSFVNWKSILDYNYDKTIVTQSFSKSHAMTGFRIGYVIANPQIIDKMSKFEALCLTNVSEPIQYAAMKALEADTLDNTNTIQRRLEVLIKKANEMNLDFIVPDGAMYLFARVNQEGFDGVKFATALLDQGLAVAPGEGFGDYKKFIRLSACQEERVLSDGMNILSGFLRDKQ